MAVTPVIPQTITVHLGSPDSNAQNVTLPFSEYIKNVASSEIYPTWGESALYANIYAQISYALNRVYLQFYRSRGYNFDITSSTAFDQKFINGRNIFENIDRIVDDIFTSYIRRIGFVEPLAAKYCNGTTVTCEGLSQWGSENLSQQGYSYIEILRYYYGDNIELVVNAPIRDIPESYPGEPLRRGSVGQSVVAVQVSLNRISQNYPLIPKIYPVDGIFGENTENAVRTFQRIFNLSPDGVVGRATWNKIVTLYVGILNLSELESEGQRFYDFQIDFDTASVARVSSISTAQTISSIADNPDAVRLLQYYLSVIAEFYDTVEPPQINSVYDEATRNAVAEFQRTFNLPSTGEVDRTTWESIFNAFEGIVETAFRNSDFLIVSYQPFSGELLEFGSTGEEVTTLQSYLTEISLMYTNITAPSINGVFDRETETAVKNYQAVFNLPQTGIVDAYTWNSIGRTYTSTLEAYLTREIQFPGYTLKEGDSDRGLPNEFRRR